MAEILKLGELIKQVELWSLRCDSETPCARFDFVYFHPTSLRSYRGYYDQLALGYAKEGEAPSVKNILMELKSAVGATFEGWKGGQYVMTMETPVWVANPGESGSTGIIGVRPYYGGVVLETKYIDS